MSYCGLLIVASLRLIEIAPREKEEIPLSHGGLKNSFQHIESKRRFISVIKSLKIKTTFCMWCPNAICTCVWNNDNIYIWGWMSHPKAGGRGLDANTRTVAPSLAICRHSIPPASRVLPTPSSSRQQRTQHFEPLASPPLAFCFGLILQSCAPGLRQGELWIHRMEMNAGGARFKGWAKCSGHLMMLLCSRTSSRCVPEGTRHIREGAGVGTRWPGHLPNIVARPCPESLSSLPSFTANWNSWRAFPRLFSWFLVMSSPVPNPRLFLFSFCFPLTLLIPRLYCAAIWSIH